MISRASLAIGLFAGISVGVANASDLTCRARIERTCLLSGCELLPTDNSFIFHVDRDWLEWKSKIGLGFGQMSMQASNNRSVVSYTVTWPGSASHFTITNDIDPPIFVLSSDRPNGMVLTGTCETH